ncbi:MAG: radical SAM protein [Candidatus Omnitrophica bacterium]|nr:radical SAM protein [Candidatus Omnitrophota bacterium]MBU1048249.1 radical SAM protein [Candidatus Omnitrophota bacterium]MBU1630847.1 radical SAM protein [Candidatus Omnitrophota bacterium]MBU1888661.1 radical SAM protein [Candidatus Omnitrophota bacterium]
MKNILLVNPWICDFAAYDLWMRPVGLLRIASLLKAHGCNLSYIDFLNRNHPKIKNLARNDSFGCGKFYKRKIQKPEPIKDIQRPYSIYGLPEKLAIEEVKNILKPDFIFMTSGMTYWYPGVEHTAKFLKGEFPDVPILLGGIYATLLPEHAKSLEGIGYVISGSDLSSVCVQLSSILGQNIASPKYYIYPEYSLLSDTSSLVVETSKGCPFNCSYCGSKLFHGQFVQRQPKEVVDEIEFYREKYGVKDIAFYDDALLVNADKHIIPILDGVLRRGITVNFHTPNGLHVRFIDKKLAKKLKESNFKTITLSFETVNPIRQKNTGGKVTTEEFKTAVENLKSVGFSGKDIGVYLMIGMPYQKQEEVEEGIKFLHNLKVHITLVTYSLVPHTMDEKILKDEGIIDDNLDPLWHNDTILPLIRGNFSFSSIRKLRDKVSALNRKI